MISGPVAPLYAVANHWQAYSEARRAAGKRARSEDWRVSRLVIVAPTDAEAEERVYGEQRLQPLLLQLHAQGDRGGEPPVR